MDRIVLTGMEFHGHHGCLPEEREQGQLFFVDAELFLDLAPAGKSDALQDTVDYAAVFACIRQVAEGTPMQLIEALAERIAETVLREFPKLQRIALTVHKPQAPIPGKFRDVSVTVERART